MLPTRSLPHPPARASLRRYTNPEKLYRAQVMRANPTRAEAILRANLVAPRFPGFRCQSELRGYVADFWCPRRRLVVEADGGYHQGRAAIDRKRDDDLAKLGIATLRIPNETIEQNLETALQLIEDALAKRPIFRSWNAKQGISPVRKEGARPEKAGVPQCIDVRPEEGDGTGQITTAADPGAQRRPGNTATRSVQRVVRAGLQPAR